jgi:hypothetical protein
MKKLDDAVTTLKDHSHDPGMASSPGDLIETERELPSVSGDETPVAPEGPDAKPDLDGPSPDETGAAAEPPPDGDYDVGYRKPPIHTRFQKGQSGNPSGRPAGRKNILELIAEEAYRMVWDYKLDDIEQIPAIQYVLRAQFKLAANGHGPAQRAFIKLVMEVAKEELKAEEKRKAAEQAEATKTEDRDDNPLARAVAHYEAVLRSRPEGDTQK